MLKKLWEFVTNRRMYRPQDYINAQISKDLHALEKTVRTFGWEMVEWHGGPGVLVFAFVHKGDIVKDAVRRKVKDWDDAALAKQEPASGRVN
jgi:hypothetical protein